MYYYFDKYDKNCTICHISEDTLHNFLYSPLCPEFFFGVGQRVNMFPLHEVSFRLGLVVTNPFSSFVKILCIKYASL